MSESESPWYDLRGWLGVKQQLSIYLSNVCSRALYIHICSTTTFQLLIYWKLIATSTAQSPRDFYEENKTDNYNVMDKHKSETWLCEKISDIACPSMVLVYHFELTEIRLWPMGNHKGEECVCTWMRYGVIDVTWQSETGFAQLTLNFRQCHRGPDTRCHGSSLEAVQDYRLCAALCQCSTYRLGYRRYR